MRESNDAPAAWAAFRSSLVDVLKVMQDEDGVVDLAFFPAGVEMTRLSPTKVWCAEPGDFEVTSGIGNACVTVATAEAAAGELVQVLSRRVPYPDAVVVGWLTQRKRLMLAQVAPELHQAPIDAAERRELAIRRAPVMSAIDVDALFQMDGSHRDPADERHPS